jgi:hypothetical protein
MSVLRLQGVGKSKPAYVELSNHFYNLADTQVCVAQYPKIRCLRDESFEHPAPLEHRSESIRSAFPAAPLCSQMDRVPHFISVGP